MDGLSAEALTKTIEIPWTKYFEDRIDGPAGPVTLGESIYQVVSHSMYHRGQANRRLRELGAEPPLVDYIAWLWFDRPEPDWGTQRIYQVWQRCWHSQGQIHNNETTDPAVKKTLIWIVTLAVAVFVLVAPGLCFLTSQPDAPTAQYHALKVHFTSV